MNSEKINYYTKKLEALKAPNLYKVVDQLLSSLDDEDLFDLFTKVIENEDYIYRECGAYALGILEYNDAIPFLKKAYKRAPARRRGSYIFAMSSLDCSREIDFLIEVAIEGNFETRNHVINILNDIGQNFVFSEKEYKNSLHKIEQLRNLDVFPELKKSLDKVFNT